MQKKTTTDKSGASRTSGSTTYWQAIKAHTLKKLLIALPQTSTN